MDFERVLSGADLSGTQRWVVAADRVVVELALGAGVEIVVLGGKG